MSDKPAAMKPKPSNPDVTAEGQQNNDNAVVVNNYIDLSRLSRGLRRIGKRLKRVERKVDGMETNAQVMHQNIVDMKGEIVRIAGRLDELVTASQRDDMTDAEEKENIAEQQDLLGQLKTMGQKPTPAP